MDDPARRRALRDLVVTGADGELAGLPRDAGFERGLGLVLAIAPPGRRGSP